MKKAAFHNLGCKVNAYELDAMEQLLRENGYEIVSFEEKADIYIINTCSVTNIADRKSRQMLHRAKKMNPQAVVVAVGCYVQTHQEEVLEDTGIDLCIGNQQKGQIGEIIEKYLMQRISENEVFSNVAKDAEEIDISEAGNLCEEVKVSKYNLFSISDIGKEQEYQELRVKTTKERCRAFIKIQDGCNQFCSYCIIPYARGRVRSRRPENVLKEIEEMSLAGYQEFVLTGIHLSSYGTDFAQEKPRADQFGERYLLDLLKKVHALSGVRRIRLGSLEPRIISREFLRELSAMSKICPHFHLSLQSGCDETLKRMNRHYSAAEFMEKVQLIREVYEHPAITTDVIVGFPGEDEKEFEKCKAFLNEVNFYEMHIFKYSKRKNTPAATMAGQLTQAQKAARSDVLEEMEKRQSAQFRRYYIGREVEVLFEECKEIDGQKYWIGHTPEYVMVACPVECFGEANPVNEIYMVKVQDLFKDQFVLGKRS